jgi:hypothetical protein
MTAATTDRQVQLYALLQSLRNDRADKWDAGKYSDAALLGEAIDIIEKGVLKGLI